MALPEAVISYVYESAEREGGPTPQLQGTLLFKLGVLDSFFRMVDFVPILKVNSTLRLVTPMSIENSAAMRGYIGTSTSTRAEGQNR
jgi:hypothetical protein